MIIVRRNLAVEHGRERLPNGSAPKQEQRTPRLVHAKGWSSTKQLLDWYSGNGGTAGKSRLSRRSGRVRVKD
jgi:hypothetical protein